MATKELEMEEFYRRIAKKLFFLRTSTNRTQEEVAEYCKVDRSTYGYYELAHTRPSVFTLFKLAHLYGVSIDYILGAKDADLYFDLKNTPTEDDYENQREH